MLQASGARRHILPSPHRHYSTPTPFSWHPEARGLEGISVAGLGIGIKENTQAERREDFVADRTSVDS